jgi:uncharacterized protein YqhQ
MVFYSPKKNPESSQLLGFLFPTHNTHLRIRTYMNFNLNIQVDKVMNKLSESKTLRVWTYLIMVSIIIGILVWQVAPILQAVAKIIEVTK